MSAHPNSIYCSGLFQPDSLSARADAAEALADFADNPEQALIKRQESWILTNWAEGLGAASREVARAILAGETQASLARRLGVSEAAITKRLARVTRKGREDLRMLRRAALLR